MRCVPFGGAPSIRGLGRRTVPDHPQCFYNPPPLSKSRLLTAAMGGLGPTHTSVRDKCLILQHAACSMLTGSPGRVGGQPDTTPVHATRHVLHLEAQGRAQVASTLHALPSMLLDYAAHHWQTRCTAECPVQQRAGTFAYLLSRQEPLPRNPSPSVNSRTGSVIGVCCAHYSGPAIFPATPSTPTNALDF